MTKRERSAKGTSSRFLSMVLRHRPEQIGVRLDPQGWVEVDALIEGCARAGKHLSRARLEEIVRNNNKKRFAFSQDGRRIRANQGHSVKVNLGYSPEKPPPKLYHGTVAKSLESIFVQGLTKRRRHHVHLSMDLETATRVGARRGAPLILEIDAEGLWKDGGVFYCTPNGVWLIDSVPKEYVRLLGDEIR